MTTKQFWKKVSANVKRFPDQRKGQIAFNVLGGMCPNLRIPEEFDPFYDDKKLKAFSLWLESIANHLLNE